MSLRHGGNRSRANVPTENDIRTKNVDISEICEVATKTRGLVIIGAAV